MRTIRGARYRLDRANALADLLVEINLNLSRERCRQNCRILYLSFLLYKSLQVTFIRHLHDCVKLIFQ